MNSSKYKVQEQNFQLINQQSLRPKQIETEHQRKSPIHMEIQKRVSSSALKESKSFKDYLPKENRYIIPILIESKIVSGFDSPIKKITQNRTPTQRCLEEREKFENRLNLMLGRKPSNSISHRVQTEKCEIKDIFRAQTPVNQVSKEAQQLEEITFLDLSNDNLQLKQDNIKLRQQVQKYQEEIGYNNEIIRKLKLNNKQLNQFNAQYQQQIELLTNQITKAESDLKQKNASEVYLKGKLVEKEMINQQLNKRLGEFSKIEEDIKQIEQFYLEIFQKISRQTKIQQSELAGLQFLIDGITKISTHQIHGEEIPLDLLFRYRQKVKAQQPSEQDIFQAQEANTLFIQDIHKNLKSNLENMCQQYVNRQIG
ncbi:hypothetical protein pb186bvf_012800 [Paramecium bursaria]